MARLEPGKPARNTSTGRPIMVLLELLGRKQSLRIIWELKDGSETFRSLQSRCGDISPTILNRRLAEMREANIIDHQDGEGYQLTADGKDLMKKLAPLNAWSKRWAKRAQN